MRRTPVPVHLYSDAGAALAEAASVAHPRETGGLLLGWWDDGCVVVRDAIEVVDPAATSNSWSRDADVAQRALDAALAGHEHPWLGYVGDWHSHPAPCGPSAQDRRAIRNASRQYTQPLVLLIQRTDGTLDIDAAHRGRRRRAHLRSDDPRGATTR